MRCFKFAMTSLLATLAAGSQSVAQDTGLYAQTAPDDASFVRFLGFGDSKVAHFAGVDFALSPETSGAYLPISAADLTDGKAGSYVSVVNRKDAPDLIVSEGPRTRTLKVFLFLLNTTDQTLDLRLADNSATVIDAISSGKSGQRGVNPVSVSLGVFPDGSDTPLATFDVSLRRGQNLSFVAGPSGVELIENRFGPVVNLNLASREDQ